MSVDAGTESSLGVRACSLEELRASGVRVVTAHGRTIAVFLEGERVFALDNRCPHMGFPLHRGTVRDGVLTCHWHHANFDLASGCTFNLFTDDAVAYPAEVRDGAVWIGARASDGDSSEVLLSRLDKGLEHNVSLVLAKASIALEARGMRRHAVTRAALFGVRNRAAGWSTGLSIMTALTQVADVLDEGDRPLALFHGLTHLARSTAGQRPSFDLPALPVSRLGADRLGRWFRDFVEVRQSVAAERTLVSAAAAGFRPAELVAIVGAACTDHLYLDVGHTLDFANKAFELLDEIGWEHAGVILAALVPVLAASQRMEESSSWRRPVDVAGLVRAAADDLGSALRDASDARLDWTGHAALAEIVLDAEPAEILEEIVRLARSGIPVTEVSCAVAYAASRRAVHFSVTNEVSDWETVHHAFTYANAVDQTLRRAPSPLVARGILDAAMAVSLERFLNIPRRPVPTPTGRHVEVADLLAAFDEHGGVDEAAQLVAEALDRGGHAEVVRALGHALLREDSGFHEFQMFEAGIRQWRQLADPRLGDHVLVGVTRYLAAHAPTRRAQFQTFDVATRLQRGEELHADAR